MRGREKGEWDKGKEEGRKRGRKGGSQEGGEESRELSEISPCIVYSQALQECWMFVWLFLCLCFASRGCQQKLPHTRCAITCMCVKKCHVWQKKQTLYVKSSYSLSFFQVTLDTNKPAMSLHTLFPSLLPSADENAPPNAMGFKLLAGPEVTIVASKSSGISICNSITVIRT